jgi:hypothetical protein
MQFSTQFHHLTHDHHRWRLEFFSFGAIGKAYAGTAIAELTPGTIS